MGKRRQKLGEPRRLLGDLVLVEETTRLAMPRAPSLAISLVPTNQSHFIRSTGREGKQNRLDRRCWAMLYFFDRRIHLVITITEPNRTDDTALHHLASSSSSSTHLLDSSFFF